MCAAWFAAVGTSAFDIKFAQLGAYDKGVSIRLDGYNGVPENTQQILKVSVSIPSSNTDLV